jgi:peroxiredoxin
MAESSAMARPIDPVTKAAQTGIGRKLAAARGGVSGLPMSRKELKKLVRMQDGVSMMTQAPRTSSDTIGTLEHMLRMVPTTRRQPPARLGVGDRVPDFSLVGSNGETASLASLRGTQPFALRLTRAMGTTTICPACVPGLDDLTRTSGDFDALGAKLIVVFPVTHEQTKVLVDTLELPYPIYSDEEMTLYKEFETGYSGGIPLPAWVVADREGVIRFLWRATEGGLYDHYAESSEVLDVLRVIQRG